MSSIDDGADWRDITRIGSAWRIEMDVCSFPTRYRVVGSTLIGGAELSGVSFRPIEIPERIVFDDRAIRNLLQSATFFFDRPENLNMQKKSKPVKQDALSGAADNLLRNPAAAGAFFAGDMENFRVAAMPGGIEAQEKAGQASFVANSTLPIELHPPRAAFEAIGIVFGEPVDGLFVSVRFPEGWKKKATDHDMHSYILDEKGRIRIRVFYKAAFYDRRADARLMQRYTYSDYMRKPGSENASPDTKECFVCGVKDGGSPATIAGGGHPAIFLPIGEHDGDYKQAEALGQEALAYLEKHYPDWRNPLAYWEDA